tara:strand:+ start:485 stop:817 length:333 start_codon:yes stop_codon:yes gene_type:complete
MAFEFKNTKLITNSSDTAAVAVEDSDSFNVHRFVIDSAHECTIKIEHSPDDGTTWFELKEYKNATSEQKSETLSLDRPWEKLRVNVTAANASASIDVWLIQLYDRTGTTV